MQLAGAWARLLHTRAPSAAHRPRSARSQRCARLSAAADAFERWLRDNPLPGYPETADGGGSAGAPAPHAAAAAAAAGTPQHAQRQEQQERPVRRRAVGLGSLLAHLEALQDYPRWVDGSRGAASGWAPLPGLPQTPARLPAPPPRLPEPEPPHPHHPSTPSVAWAPGAHAWVAADPAGRPAFELRLPRVVPGPQTAYAAAAAAAGAGAAAASGATPLGAGVAQHIRQLRRAPGSGSAEGAVGAWACSSGSSGSSGGGGGEEEEADGWLTPEEVAALAELRAAGAGPVPSVGDAGREVCGSLRIGACALVLLAADAAALGVWREGRLVRHKVLSGYTVRGARGGAQAAFEARGGGQPTAGSALRRREARRLWQAAAARLDEWKGDLAGCHALFRSGAERNWSLLYAARWAAAPRTWVGRQAQPLAAPPVARATPVPRPPARLPRPTPLLPFEPPAQQAAASRRPPRPAVAPARRRRAAPALRLDARRPPSA
jgi:hypothetical protein